MPDVDDSVLWNKVATVRLAFLGANGGDFTGVGDVIIKETSHFTKRNEKSMLGKKVDLQWTNAKFLNGLSLLIKED
jgi:hypothetical protein